jgi:zinc protease
LRLILEAGAAAEQPELGGVAELTGRLLSEGAAGRSALEMAAWLDRLGAAFGASVGYDVSSLSMHFLSDVSDGALDYLRAVVREPAFEEEEVTRVRQERLDEIERHLDEPAVLADLRLIRTIYGDHPYGRPAGGEPETVASLGARDAVALRFDDWTGAAGPGELPAPSSEAPAGGLLLVDREHSAQAEIRVGRIGMEYAAPDFFPATLANAILGGLFNSRVQLADQHEPARGQRLDVRGPQLVPVSSRRGSVRGEHRGGERGGRRRDPRDTRRDPKPRGASARG